MRESEELVGKIQEGSFSEVTGSRDVQNLVQSLVRDLSQKDATVATLQGKLELLEVDFRFNLGLLAERDSALDQCEAKLRDQTSKIIKEETDISDLKIQVDELEKKILQLNNEKDSLKQQYEGVISQKNSQIKEIQSHLESSSKHFKHDIAMKHQWMLKEINHITSIYDRKMELMKKDYEKRIDGIKKGYDEKISSKNKELIEVKEQDESLRIQVANMNEKLIFYGKQAEVIKRENEKMKDLEKNWLEKECKMERQIIEIKSRCASLANMPCDYCEYYKNELMQEMEKVKSLRQLMANLAKLRTVIKAGGDTDSRKIEEYLNQAEGETQLLKNQSNAPKSVIETMRYEAENNAPHTKENIQLKIMPFMEKPRNLNYSLVSDIPNGARYGPTELRTETQEYSSNEKEFQYATMEKNIGKGSRGPALSDNSTPEGEEGKRGVGGRGSQGGGRMSSRTQSEDSLDSAIPPWKRELILRRRALLARTQGGIPTPGSGGALNSAAASLLVAGHSGAVKTAAAAFSAISGESVRRSPESRAGGSGVKCVAMKLEGLECDASSISRMNGGKDGQAAAVADGAHIAKGRSKPPMGEGKRLGVGRAGSRRKSPRGSVSTPDDDDDEELRYGPGIVNRLKSKYLSMTLRESQTKGVRPPLTSMRRAASLEDILDGPVQQTPKELRAPENKSTAPKIGRYNKRTGAVTSRPTLHLPTESLKRARSVETLLKSPVSGLLSPTLAKEDVIIIEGNKEVVTDSEGSRVKHSGVVEEELPPPDVVRQTLKIFEYTSPPPSPGGKKSSKATNGVATSSLIVRATPAVAIPPPSPPHGPKPQLSPKPVILQMPSTKNTMSSSVKVSAPKAAPESPQKIGKQPFDARPTVLPTAAKTSPTSLLPAMSKPAGINPPSPSAKKTSPTKPFKPLAVSKTSPSSSPVEPKPPSPLPDAVVPNGQAGQDPGETKAVSRAALENIRKDGLTIKFQFDGAQKPKSYLPGGSPSVLTHGAENVSRQVGVIRPMTKPPAAPTTAKRATPPRSIVPPQPTSSATPDVVKSALTEREKEKNHINRVKSTEPQSRKVPTTPPQLVSPSAGATKLVTVVKEVPSLSKVEPPKVTALKKPSEDTSDTQPFKTTLWEPKNRWNQESNSVTYSFKDRPVPDYIENDGMIIKSRNQPRRNEPGSVWLTGTTRGESSDDPEDDDEGIANALGWVSSDPPPPCNLQFEGSNVLINGRSNLRKSSTTSTTGAGNNSSAGGARQLRFNDEATRTFVYPSESSYMDDSPSSTSPSGMHGSSPLSPLPQTPPPPSTSAPSPTLAPSAGGTLSSYTPSKIQIGEDFQLGITRTIPQPSTSHAFNQTDASKEDNPEEKEEEYLKPAEEGVTWSAETAADLLF